ncbi:Uncharacterized protein OBRU01_09166 [Operophtera brumata]|uniref:Glucose-methanol-choline oxidoreductase N-terminal domain-containing protein n=1 Tax=Operophtera brumata TaxID=104452 RepID=A0A0L7LH02_OPEBR|nr:Uncharacterized protein OBRU01_09166 [Operophtera brumata]
MTLLGSPLDWQYATLPNNVSCLSSLDQQCRFSRGKCLGGSTSINYMLYTRGNRQDYDDYNIPGWTWQDLEPYFLRYEGLQILDQLPASSKPYHNTCGIMKLEFFDDPENPWQERISQGFNELGFQFNADVNGVSQIGVTRNTGYVYKGERMSTARAYLGKCKVKRTLKVAKNAYCTGVIFDDEKVAKGVTVVQGLITKKIYARKEVILSAGTIETPKILMLSGIGPAEHLQQMGIPVIADLPAGNNMSDHVLPLLFILVDKGNEVEDITGLFELIGNAAEFLESRDGPLASNGLVDLNVFANTSCYNSTSKKLEAGPGCELPTMQLIPAYIDKKLVTLGKTLVQNSIHLDDNVIDQIAEINSEYAVMVFSPVVLNPCSQGYIRLASRNPLDRPAIFPNYLSDSRDADEMLRSIGIVEDLIETAVFKMHEAKLFHLKFPGCPSYEEGREEYWRCYIKHMTYSVFHAVGTCSLQTCLDTRLRVKGVRGLRVADASIFPRVMRGNTAASTIAMGERVVDFILEEK